MAVGWFARGGDDFECVGRDLLHPAQNIIEGRRATEIVIRNDQPRLPAIALTAFARPEDKQRAIEAGFLIHLAKPVESADLVTAAKLAVRRPNRAVDTGAD